MKSKKQHRYVIGIDEAGRGPLAGPVVIGAVVPKGLSLKESQRRVLWGIKDSKKLNVQKREEWYKILKKNFECHYIFINHKTIDKINISRATLLGVKKILKKFKKKPDIVMLDGSLHAPKEYNQKTIIKGDEKIPIISAASVIAKVTRDKKMMYFHKKFPKYDFDKHKGYGTKLHYKKLKKYGLSEIHRKTFCGDLKKYKK